MTILVTNITGSKLVTQCLIIPNAANFANCCFGAGCLSTVVRFVIGLVTAIIAGANQCVTILVTNIIGSKLVTQRLAITHTANFANRRFRASSISTTVWLITGLETTSIARTN